MDTTKLNLPTDSAARKAVPIVRGCMDYFPAALAAVAALSKKGNDKHSPGEEMHHARGKSSDHADCIVRHLMDRGTVDPEDGIRHSVKVAWRALALLQEELEAAGEAPLARGARLPKNEPVPKYGAWFPHDGGFRPVLASALVEVRHRDGRLVGPRLVGSFVWEDREGASGSDILEYRVVRR